MEHEDWGNKVIMEGLLAMADQARALHEKPVICSECSLPGLVCPLAE